eukprot:UN01001
MEKQNSNQRNIYQIYEVNTTNNNDLNHKTKYNNNEFMTSQKKQKTTTLLPPQGIRTNLTSPQQQTDNETIQDDVWENDAPSVFLSSSAISSVLIQSHQQQQQRKQKRNKQKSIAELNEAKRLRKQMKRMQKSQHNTPHDTNIIDKDKLRRRLEVHRKITQQQQNQQPPRIPPETPQNNHPTIINSSRSTTTFKSQKYNAMSHDHRHYDVNKKNHLAFGMASTTTTTNDLSNLDDFDYDDIDDSVSRHNYQTSSSTSSSTWPIDDCSDFNYPSHPEQQQQQQTPRIVENTQINHVPNQQYNLLVSDERQSGGVNLLINNNNIITNQNNNNNSNNNNMTQPQQYIKIENTLYTESFATHTLSNHPGHNQFELPQIINPYQNNYDDPQNAPEYHCMVSFHLNTQYQQYAAFTAAANPHIITELKDQHGEEEMTEEKEEEQEQQQQAEEEQNYMISNQQTKPVQKSTYELFQERVKQRMIQTNGKNWKETTDGWQIVYHHEVDPYCGKFDSLWLEWEVAKMTGYVHPYKELQQKFQQDPNFNLSQNGENQQHSSGGNGGDYYIYALAQTGQAVVATTNFVVNLTKDLINTYIPTPSSPTNNHHEPDHQQQSKGYESDGYNNNMYQYD